MTESSVFELPERMDIAAAEAVHLEMDNILAAGQPVTVDGNKVVKIDTSGVQLLYAFKSFAEMHHLELSWQAPSECLSEAFSFLGMGDFFSSDGVNLQEQSNG